MLVKSADFLIVFFTLLFTNVLCKPAVDAGSDPLSICYSLNCPEGTSVCGKHSEISLEDKKKLNVQIRCYDEDGIILKSKNGTEDNPFGPNVYYKGTKLSAVIRVLPLYVYAVDPNTEEDGKEFNNVPYHSVPSYPQAKTGPKSEVEDLNSR